MLAVEVPAPAAEEVRRELHRLGLVDPSRKMTKRDGRVLIPVKGPPPLEGSRHGGRVVDGGVLEARDRPRDPREVLAERLAAEGLPRDASPRRWERLGDVVVLRVPSIARERARDLGRVVGEVLHARTVVEDVSGVHGPFRTPDVRVLWGDGTETEHVEDGIRFRLDVAKIMFSSGNLAERTSLAARVRPSEVVVDLFAGIGYFAIPVAVRARPSRVYACEANPAAFAYLEANIRRNRASNVVPLRGDCRETAPAGVAEWVLMGHFDAPRYLDVAVRALRDEGRILVHGLFPREDVPGRAEAEVAAAARSAGADVLEARARVVKSYAPSIRHAVVELRARRGPKGLSGRGPSGPP